jgi:hypothetical protein
VEPFWRLGPGSRERPRQAPESGQGPYPPPAIFMPKFVIGNSTGCVWFTTGKVITNCCSGPSRSRPGPKGCRHPFGNHRQPFRRLDPRIFATTSRVVPPLRSATLRLNRPQCAPRDQDRNTGTPFPGNAIKTVLGVVLRQGCRPRGPRPRSRGCGEEAWQAARPACGGRPISVDRGLPGLELVEDLAGAGSDQAHAP